ncbi:hypothetical protein [Streptomyces shenzhenensis]|uniref:hypothetical protein n=1 Tax=Streptomyces shenzhenensis TaxID=943815 RepID=UPI0036C9BC3B
MTHPTSNGRAADTARPAINFRTETRPNGSTVLSLRTVAAPYVLNEHRFELDPYVTRALLHALARELDPIPDPGPRPEAAALLAALDSDDPTAFTTARDAYTDRLHHLLTNGGEAA